MSMSEYSVCLSKYKLEVFYKSSEIIQKQPVFKRRLVETKTLLLKVWDQWQSLLLTFPFVWLTNKNSNIVKY